MRYIVANNQGHAQGTGGTAFLLSDGWDDWFKFQTLFTLVIFDDQGERHHIGQLKIGQAGLKPARTIEPGHRSPELPPEFEYLNDDFFSLGQDESYYETLRGFGDELADSVLVALRDCAFDVEIFKAARREDVMSESLLRSVSASNVMGKLHRLATGNPEPTPFHFEYKMADSKLDFVSPSLEFKVTPKSEPPTNVHVIIGRNGAGKTSLLQSLAKATLNQGDPANEFGTLTLHGGDGENEAWAFASLVYVSFSVFDDFTLPSPRAAKLRAAQVSLRGEKSAQVADKTGKPTKAGRDLFINSLAVCRRGSRRGRWQEAIRALESDPLFEEADFGSLLDDDQWDWREAASDLFEKLSSGHAIVLITITKLVELVDEKTLILMDEP
jgi:hypothetical protein